MADIVSPLPDLTDLALREVLAADDSALAHALRRVRDEAEHPQDVVAGFQNVMV